MKSPRILLIGIGGVYNYGCEAIVRGTEIILRKQWPDAEIVYASRHPKYDQTHLEGTHIKIVCRSRYTCTNIAAKLLSYTNIKWRPRSDSLSLLKNMDAVFSIGGDLYTLYSDGDYSVGLPKFGDAAQKRKVPYILWGASVGPFTQNPQAEQFYQKHLANVRLIAAREKDTIRYLMGIGVMSNVISCADPAFAVSPEITKVSGAKNDKLTIGINLSPFSLRFSGLDNEQGICEQARMVEQIIRTFDAKVILVPHVVCDFIESDDDLRHLQKIKKEISREYQSQVCIVDTNPGFIGIKRKLVQCDLVIAARMHCAINAMAGHVPSLLLSYSQKARGMCEYIYGHRNWVLSLSDFSSEQGLRTIQQMLDSKRDIHTYLVGRIPEIQHDAYNPLKSLTKILL